jgi:hypothetical protein
MRSTWAVFLAAVSLGAASPGHGAEAPATSGDAAPQTQAVVSEPWAWETVASWATRRFDEDIADIDFDGQIGLAVSVDGQVFVSRDAGATWGLSFTTQECGSESDLRACLAKGRALVAGGYQGLFISTDQGATWRGPRVYVTHGDDSRRPGMPYQVAQGADLANVYSLSADSTHPERMMASARDMHSMWGPRGRRMVLVTLNGGLTWRDRLRGAGPDCPAPDVLQTLRFESGGRSLGCPCDRDAGFVVLSTDNGATWARLPVPARAAQAMCIESRGPEVWVGDFWGEILHSADQGETWDWRKRFSPPGSWEMHVLGIAFASRRLGIAVGQACWRTGTEGVIYRTTNGGESWTLDLHTPDFLPFCATACPDGEWPFLVGGCATGRPAIRGVRVPGGLLPYLDLPPATLPPTPPAPGRVSPPRDRPTD